MSNATQTSSLPASQIALALGRIFAMGARPSQPGDVAEYERCRAIIMAAAAVQP